ncbi:hypothetical protein QFZ75_007990 [Streptomyces sp. V3I8]|uniref:hypothetical protein n=1 Tax=Streptomyces sp. V3I8 TaxID=3042279 RepID=UPI00277E409A|nr:hypothetical protein [Streptomyces sp. V3I8]MDQ1041488.1 hypothetical protein [Streptomyces sp. V3I8]
MTDHHHDDDKPEMGSLGHLSGRFLAPTAVLASALSASHDLGLAFSLGAVVFWLLFVFYMGMAAMHDWKACSRCLQPPPREATPSARAKMALAHHTKWKKRLVKVALVLVMLHAIFPKPYMGPWWTRALAGMIYCVVALRVSRDVILLETHRRYHEECHKEWCRAGRKRSPAREKAQLRQMRDAHYGVWWVAVLAPATCALGLFASSHPDILLQITYGMCLMALAFSVFDIAGHADGPCLHCVKNLPDRPEEAAERRMPWLRTFHVLRYWLLWGAFASWGISLALAGTVPAKILVCVTAVSVLIWSVLERVHSPVKPWCPWCRDDGGEEADFEVPDPSTSAPAPA